jgi:sporulation protein YlmC with PRC-barrel domain
MAQEKGQTMLIRLSNTNLKLADPAQDVRGHRVVDEDGKDLGEVDDLIIDRVEMEVRFLEVASGDLFGFGPAKALIPVEAITRISDAAVYIKRRRQHVVAAPRYNPDLIRQDVGDQGHVGDRYRYYGYLPFWGPGYRYPPLPVIAGPTTAHVSRRPRGPLDCQ